MKKKDVNWFEFERLVKRHGVTKWLLRKYAQFLSPYIKVSQSHTKLFEDKETNGTIYDIVSLKVKYPTAGADLQGWVVPDELLPYYLELLSDNLHKAVYLEQELDGKYQLRSICSIWPDSDKELNKYFLGKGLNGWVRYFAWQFEKLVKINLPIAQTQYGRWQTYVDPLFVRLSIWAGGISNLVCTADFGHWLYHLAESQFWCEHHHRDLLLSLRARWTEIPFQIQSKICLRILAGPQDWSKEDEQKYSTNRAKYILDMLYWLQRNNCELPLDLEVETAHLRSLLLDWTEADSDNAVKSLGPRGGTVSVDLDCSKLLESEDGSVLTQVETIEQEGKSFLVEPQPFRGLCRSHPQKALNVLIAEARKDHFPADRWRILLMEVKNEQKDNLVQINLLEFLSLHISKFDGELLDYFSSWLEKQIWSLVEQEPEKIEKTLSLIVSHLLKTKKNDESWEHLLATAQHISKVICEKILYELNISEKDEAFIKSSNLFVLLDRLLSSQYSHKVLVSLGSYIDILYKSDSEWTQKNVFSVFEQKVSPGTEADKAIFEGLYCRDKVQNIVVLRPLIPWLAKIAQGHPHYEAHQHRRAAEFLLWAWINAKNLSVSELIESKQLREVLIKGGSKLAFSVLEYIWMEYGHEKDDQGKLIILETFFLEVWPKQKSVNTPGTTRLICGIVFKSQDTMSRLGKITLPLLTTVGDNCYVFYQIDSLPFKYDPGYFAEVLMKVLPDDQESWPPKSAELLRSIDDLGGDFRKMTRWVYLMNCLGKSS